MHLQRNRNYSCLLIAAVVILCFLGTGCGEKKSADLMLHLTFDEGSGISLSDSAKKLPDTELHYRFTHAAYMEDKEPQWRARGIEKGSLLFDGSSTWLEYSPEEICVSGEAFSISVWVAPRAFEWDDPNAANTGNAHLTAIVSQYDKAKKQGFLLGYQRFGRLCFEIGTGDEWITLWGEDENLKKYEWNQVTATFDGKNGQVCLYLNGKQIASAWTTMDAKISPAENKKLLVGKNSDAEQIAAGTYNMFAGLMDELKLYSTVISEEEIDIEDAPEIAFEDIWLENILTGDIYRPQYHGAPYQHWMNEPHAPVYYNGMYHLFYQSNMIGTYWRNICWGHMVSTDMVNWKPIKEAITPAENTVAPDGIWSGGATLDKNGIPLLFFTAGNDSFSKDGLLSNQNIGVAYPKDLSDPELTDWIVCDQLAIAQQAGQGRIGEFRDPHIFREGDLWCMLICTGSTKTRGGSAILYETDTLELKADGTVSMNWKYMGPVYELENPSALYGTSWELPILIPLANKAGTIQKYIFMISPAPAATADNKVYYFLGDFDVTTGKFTPDEKFDNQPALLDYGCNVFTGPSVLTDPVSGDICVFSIMQDQRNGAEQGSAGWAHGVGLTRKIWLNDDGTEVKIAPIELHNQEERILVDARDLTLAQANEELKKVEGDLLYIRAVLTPKDKEEFGIRVKSDGNRNMTFFTYSPKEEKIFGDTKNKGSDAPTNSVSGALSLEDGKLAFEIYIDRSLVEAFFNDTKAITIRSYGAYEAQGMELFSGGNIAVESLYVAKIKPIY